MAENKNGSWPKIRQRTTKVKGHNYSYWVVDGGMIDGRRCLLNRKTKNDAELAANKLRTARNKLGADALRLSENQKKDAVQAIRLLQEQFTLKEAAEYYVKHHGLTDNNKTIEEVVAEYLADAKERNLRPISIHDLNSRLDRFCRQYGKTKICEISRHAINKWAGNLRMRNGETLSLMSKKHYLTVISGLFGFAVDKEYVFENPVLSKSRRKNVMTEQPMPGILDVAEAERMMRAAQEHVPTMAPALAIGFFAGLRTTEIQRLDWRHINFETKLITVSPEIAKKRRVRHVTMESNLINWLLPFKQASGFVAPQGMAWRYQFDKVRKLAKIEKWPGNAMRHGFASNHLAQCENPNLTALELGHRDTALLYDHYRNLVSKDDAKRYWSIYPKKEDNIIQFLALA